MTVQVTLMPVAKQKLPPHMHGQVKREVGSVFASSESVSIYDVLEGYNPDVQHKAILAVESHTATGGDLDRGSFESHVVKLGDRDEVAADVVGWQQCGADRPVPRRMFATVRLHELGGQPERAAVVYQDAAQWQGLLTPKEEVATLEWAIRRAVFSPGEIDFLTVERVIRQVFTEMARIYYRTAEPIPAAAETFYRSKLRLDHSDPVIHQWKRGDLWLLRRDVDWLLSGGISPASDAHPEYVDPYDFVLGLLANGDLPSTLVGPSHGDLHAKNVIVGVSGDEVEYPLLIDYGDMAIDNVIAWDFVKFEMELKVRLLVDLFRDCQPGTRAAVWNSLRGDRFSKLAQRWSQQGIAVDAIVRATQWIAFAFEFERRIAEHSEGIVRSPQREATIAPSTALDRAVAIMQSVRSQAARHLGFGRGRANQWRKELDVALAIYGLSTVKFSDHTYALDQRLFAIVSAGMAAARFLPDLSREGLGHEGLGREGEAGKAVVRETDDHKEKAPLCYHVPLRQAYRQWKSNHELDKADELLQSVRSRFDYAVPVIREHALVLADLGRADEAGGHLEAIARSRASSSTNHTSIGIAPLCEAFLEVEVLARLGRINKDKADELWEILGVEFGELHAQPPASFYSDAHDYYRMAYEMSMHHYPGGNAAVTGLLCGKADVAREIALQVSAHCKTVSLARVPKVERYWVLATAGEMALLLGEAKESRGYFTSAFGELPEGNDGLVQTTYGQICRLYRAVDSTLAEPVLDIFKSNRKFRIQPGNLGDCGGLFSQQPTAGGQQ